jgi:hypothetical protein
MTMTGEELDDLCLMVNSMLHRLELPRTRETVSAFLAGLGFPDDGNWRLHFEETNESSINGMNMLTDLVMNTDEHL